MRNRLQSIQKMRGQSMIEYTIVAGLVMVGLFAGDPSLAEQLATAVSKFFKAFSYFISLP
jgi:Flp pilus assembly pilin Flp